MKNTLTEREHDIYTFIRNYCAEQGYAPTVQEIADAMGWGSKGTVHRYLTKLVDKGKLLRPRNGWRNLSVADLPAHIDDEMILASLKRLSESKLLVIPGLKITNNIRTTKQKPPV